MTYAEVSGQARLLGNPLLFALAESNACWLDVLDERYELAEAGFAAVLEVQRRLSHAAWEADALLGLGLARLGLGRRSEGRAAFAAALEILAADRTPNTELTATLQCIAFTVEPADMESAARIAGCVDAVRQKARLIPEQSMLELLRRFEQPLVDSLGENAWARGHAAGASLTLDEAIEVARALAGTPPEPTYSP